MSLTYKRLLHGCTMTFIIVGMFYFYGISDFHVQLWKEYLHYYAYMKAVDMLLMMCIIFPLREVWKEWTCIGIFFAVRLLWELLAVNDYASANRPSIIFILFCTDVLCLIIILFLKIIKAQR